MNPSKGLIEELELLRHSYPVASTESILIGKAISALREERKSIEAFVKWFSLLGDQGRSPDAEDIDNFFIQLDVALPSDPNSDGKQEEK